MATAPWWAVVMLAAAATSLSTGAWVAVGACAVLVGLVVGDMRRNIPVLRAVSTAASLVVLAHLGHRWFFGFTASMSIGLCLIVSLLGLRRRPRRQRRLAYKIAGGVAIAAVLAAAGFGMAAASGKDRVEEGGRLAQQGLNHLADGDLKAAESAFQASHAAFASAADSIDRVWAQPARLLPGIAQNRRSLIALTHEAEDVTGTIVRVLPSVDLDALRVTNGRIDIDAVRALQDPLAQLQGSLTHLDATLKSVQSPWLVAPLTRRLVKLSNDIEKQTKLGANAIEALQQAPALLGGDGTRVYFIAFTTPAELRGLGGFMGNWAELTITNGHISMSKFGRTKDLNDGGNVGHKKIDGPTDFLQRYGRFNFDTGPGRTVGSDAWQNVTVSPHFPDVADVIAQLYPQSGGQQVDGVFVMDVEAIAALMQFTNPIPVGDTGQLVSSDNAAEFLLRGQYYIPQNTDRVDLLETIARTTVQQLLNGALPSPERLAKVLGPYTRDRHLMAWSKLASEQKMFTDVGMAGELPALDGGNGIGLSLNNAGANKIDSYLNVGFDYKSSITPAGSVGAANTPAQGSLALTLENTATVTGMPAPVVNNLAGLPQGTNRMFVSVYSALQLDTVTADGVTVGAEPGFEHGWNVYSFVVNVGPGKTATLLLNFSGQLNLGVNGGLTVLLPPTANPIDASIEAAGQTVKLRGPGVTQLR